MFIFSAPWKINPLERLAGVGSTNCVGVVLRDVFQTDSIHACRSIYSGKNQGLIRREEIRL